jgi:hypothetical protein
MQIVTYLYIVVLEECVCVCVLYFVPMLTGCHQQMQAFQNVALSVVPNISEPLRSSFSTRKCWPSSTSQRTWMCSSTAVWTPNLVSFWSVCHSPALTHILSARMCLGKSCKCLIAFKYQGWCCQIFAVHALFILYYCQHLHRYVTLLSWSKLMRCTVKASIVGWVDI